MVRKRIPRLATLARQIEQEFGYTATLEEGFCNTDRKIGRLRRPGKGRYGNRLVVRDANGAVLLDHNAAATYRRNEEVVAWMEGERGRRAK